MKHSLVGFLLCCTAGTVLIQCGKETFSSVGTQFYQSANPGSERHTTAFSSSSDTSYSVSVPCGKSYSLFLGMDKGIETKTVVVFDTVSLTGPARSVVLSFFVKPLSPSSGSPVAVSIHSMDTDSMDAAWVETALTWAEFSEAWVRDRVAGALISTSDTSQVSIELPLDILPEWIAPDRHSGLMVSADAPGCVFQLASRESDTATIPRLIPRITVKYNDSDSVVVRPIRDTYIARSLEDPPNNRLAIEDGTAKRAFLFFDVSDIPAEATVNRAELMLHADTDGSFPESGDSFAISVTPVAQGGDPSTNSGLDSTQVITGSFTGDSARVILTGFVQKWVSGVKPNAGIVVRGVQEKTGCGKRWVFDSFSDSLLAPRLDLYYSLPPTGRF
jgi:hypothetical protein